MMQNRKKKKKKKHLLSPTATSTGDVGDFGDLPNWCINSCGASQKCQESLDWSPIKNLTSPQSCTSLKL